MRDEITKQGAEVWGEISLRHIKDTLTIRILHPILAGTRSFTTISTRSTFGPLDNRSTDPATRRESYERDRFRNRDRVFAVLEEQALRREVR